MGVKLVGETGRSLSRMSHITSTLVVLGSVAFYFYGPAVTPALHAAAAAECNDLAGGNYRSYRLAWVVGTRPHWLCGNAARPREEPVDLGWMVLPDFMTGTF